MYSCKKLVVLGLIPLISKYLWKDFCRFSSKSLHTTIKHSKFNHTTPYHNNKQKVIFSKSYRKKNVLEVWSLVRDLILGMIRILNRQTVNNNLIRVTHTVKLQIGSTLLVNTDRKWNARLRSSFTLIIIVVVISFPSNQIRHVNLYLNFLILVRSLQRYSLMSGAINYFKRKITRNPFLLSAKSTFSTKTLSKIKRNSYYHVWNGKQWRDSLRCDRLFPGRIRFRIRWLGEGSHRRLVSSEQLQKKSETSEQTNHCGGWWQWKLRCGDRGGYSSSIDPPQQEPSQKNPTYEELSWTP